MDEEPQVMLFRGKSIEEMSREELIAVVKHLAKAREQDRKEASANRDFLFDLMARRRP